MIRAFFAFDLDEHFLRDAATLSVRLRELPALSRARWVAPSVMHVTLRFLGDTDEALVEPLVSLVGQIGQGRAAIAVQATSLVAFSNARRARVLGLRLEDDGATADVFAETERAVTALGFVPDPRPYRPHLTLARLREPADLRHLIAGQSVAIAGRITSMAFYKSELGKNGPSYTPLARASFSE